MFQRFIPINREHVMRVLLSGLHAFGKRNSSTTEQALVNSEVVFFTFSSYRPILQRPIAIFLRINHSYIRTSEVKLVMVGLEEWIETVWNSMHSIFLYQNMDII